MPSPSTWAAEACGQTATTLVSFLNGSFKGVWAGRTSSGTCQPVEGGRTHRRDTAQATRALKAPWASPTRVEPGGIRRPSTQGREAPGGPRNPQWASRPTSPLGRGSRRGVHMNPRAGRGSRRFLGAVMPCLHHLVQHGLPLRSYKHRTFRSLGCTFDRLAGGSTPGTEGATPPDSPASRATPAVLQNTAAARGWKPPH